MPSINVAMERSLGRGFMDLLAASVAPVVGPRDAITNVQGQISDVKTAFSSWDNCMNAVYCKWPVIAVIIVGGLIILSVVYCISRCLCCGLSCCCECCQCLKCCGNCCGCCDPPRGRKHKYLDEPYIPPHHEAYKSHDPMVAGPAPTAPFHRPTAAAATVPEPPQYAEFDVSKKSAAPAHEDALPEMPSWEAATSKKVLVEEEAVEMDQLKKPEATSAAALGAAGSASSANLLAGQNVPLMTGASATPGPASPIPSPDHRSPYSPPGAATAAGAYMAVGAAGADPYASAAHNGYNNGYNSSSPYGQSSTTLGTDQSYGMVGAAAGPGRRSPRDYNNTTPYGQDPHAQQDSYQDSYGQYPPSQPAAGGAYDSYGRVRNGSYDDYNSPQPGPNAGYGRSQSRPRPGPGPNMGSGGSYPAERMARSPPPRGAYGQTANNMNTGYSDYTNSRTQTPAAVTPARQNTYGDYSNNRTQSPAPLRQQTYEMPAAPAPANDSGFDFNSGYSRPQQTGTPAARGNGYGGGNQTQGGTGTGYRGYQGYNPMQQPGW